MKKNSGCYDCAVVCGYPANEDGEPSDILKTRVDKGIELIKSGRVKYLIFSGAAVANEFTEAEVMKKYAVSQGVSSDVIIKEEQAVSTYHNMMYVKEIMENKGFKNCVVVTNGWHLRKARHYSRKFDLDFVMEKASNPENESIFTTLWRYISVNLHMFYMRLKGYY